MEVWKYGSLKVNSNSCLVLIAIIRQPPTITWPKTNRQSSHEKSVPGASMEFGKDG